MPIYAGDNMAEVVSANIPGFFIGLPAVFPRVFTPDQCEAIDAAFAESVSLDDPVMFETKSQRICKVRYRDIALLPSQIHASLVGLLPAIDKYYGFAFSGQIEQCQHCAYDESGRSDWHMDMGYEETETRKLTMVVQLSEPSSYDGGVLEFFPGYVPAFSRLRGTVIVFPAFLVHRVTTITSGRRSSMVTWLHGPKFC